jgi:hypothetical protein
MNKITVTWDDDKQTIIRWDFDVDWTWNDFRAALKQTSEMAQDRQRLDLIANVGDVDQVPPGALGEFKRTEDRAPADDDGLRIITGSTFLPRMLAERLRKVYGITNWNNATTLEAAREMIQADRQNS